MLERQKEGIEIAKRNGRYKGRKKVKKPENWDIIFAQWKNRVISGNEAKRLLNLKNNTFYNFVNQEKSKEVAING